MGPETNVNAHFLTLGQAAKQSGLSKATISRAIRDGKLSAERSPDAGSFKIDPAELCRYAEAVKVLRAISETGDEKRPVTPLAALETGSEASLEQRIALIEERHRRELAEQRLADLKAQLEEMRAQRDKWQEQAQRLALAPPQSASVPAAPRGFWKRLFG